MSRNDRQRQIHDPSFTKDVFNKVSHTYDIVNLISSCGLASLLRKQMIQRLSAGAKPQRTLDLLCGMGETWVPIIKYAPDTQITAVDFSEEMIAGAKRRNAQYHNDNVVVLEENVLESSLKENYYDLVVCAFGLKSFDDIQINILANLTKRVLKPGGQFVFIEMSLPPNIFVKTVFLWHVRYLVPFLGAFSGNRKAFGMLAKYTLSYRNSQKASAIFAKVGLQMEYDSYLLGSASGFHGYKP
jgi:ubiquinone/menaquinone biosynthesis methyltransferase